MFLYIFIVCFVIDLKGSNTKLAALIERVSLNHNSIVMNLYNIRGTCDNVLRSKSLPWSCFRLLFYSFFLWYDLFGTLKTAQVAQGDACSKRKGGNLWEQHWSSTSLVNDIDLVISILTIKVSKCSPEQYRYELTNLIYMCGLVKCIIWPTYWISYFHVFS